MQKNIIIFFIAPLVFIGSWLNVGAENIALPFILGHSGFLILLALVNCRYGAANPLVWLPVFSLFYSVVYPIYMYTQAEYALLVMTMVVQFLALYAILLGVFFVGVINHRVFFLELPFLKSGLNPIRPSVIRRIELFVIILLTLASIPVFYILSSGIGSKRDYLDLAANGGFFSFLIFIFFSVSLSYVVLVNRALLDKGFFDWRIVFLVFFVGFCSFSLGERDWLFRLLGSIAIIHFTLRKRLRPWMLLFFIVSIWPLIALSAVMKPNVILADLVSDFSNSLVTSDFSAGARNISVILSRGYESDNVNTVLNGIFRLFQFSFFGVDNVLETGNVWYNYNFRVAEGIAGTSGWGFSIIADFLVSFGYVGSFIAFFGLGMVIAWLYTKAIFSPWVFSYYVFLSLLFVYCFRADFANLIAGLVKHGLFIYFIPFLIFDFFRRKW